MIPYLAVARQYNTLLLPSTATSLEFDVAEEKDGVLNMPGSGTPLKKKKKKKKKNIYIYIYII